MAARDIFAELDSDQLAAVGLAVNGTVSAGAGSGKTTVLAARYLRLVLEEGADVRSILCLTFTRKAAAEMRSRIYRELLASADERARPQIERFAEAQISTIDSFCSMVLRSSAQDFGYPPDFSVDDPGARRLAETEALAFLLDRREHPELAEIFARLGFERAWKELFADVAYRLCSPARGSGSDFAAMGRKARELIQEEAAAALAGAARLFASAAGLAAEAPRPGKKLKEILELEARIGARLSDPPGPGPFRFAEALALTAPLAGFSLHFGKSAEDEGAKEAMRGAREAAKLLGRLSGAEELAPLVESALALLAEFGERYRGAKRSAGIMSFRDAAVCAVELLARRKEIRAYWKRRFRFIMIDEFQDDDELQRDLLFLLAERDDGLGAGIPPASGLAPGKLFFVGDEKQSIYRFRGADVSVFRRLSFELAGIAGGAGIAGPTAAGAQAIAAKPAMPALGTNYRSESELVSFFNGLFERVFAGALEDFEARFETIKAREPTPGLGPRLVFLAKTRTPTREGYRSDDEALAEAIAAFIEDSVGRLQVPGRERGSLRAAEHEDFAILMRSTAKQYILERFLRLHSIPYAVGDPRGLFVESPANDIYAALRLCLLDDRVAYATMLRSPLVRLSDDGFVRALTVDGLPFSGEAAALLEGADLRRFERGSAILAGLRARADRGPHADLLSWLWYEEGLRLGVLRKSEAHPYLEHFDYLFALAAKADAEGKCLASFVSELEPLMGRPERIDELEAPRESTLGVRIMTVHKAKGLEFPVVIIPGMENSGRIDGAGAAWYPSSRVGVTLNLKPWDEPRPKSPNVFYELAKAEDERKRGAETKRLFYVACTRAIAHLVFAGIEGGRKSQLSFRSLLSLGLSDEGGDEAGAEALPEGIERLEVRELDEERYLRLFSGSRVRDLAGFLPGYERAGVIDRGAPRRSYAVDELNAAREASRQSGGPEEQLPSCAYDAVSERVPENAFGILCHVVLEARLAEPPRPPRFPKDLLALVPEGLRQPLLAEAVRLAARFEDSELGSRVKQAARSTEFGFILDLGSDFATEGRIDLLAELGDETIVVDFKSSRVRREGAYDAQLWLYRKAVRAVRPGRPVTSWLFWLRDGHCEERRLEFSDVDAMGWTGLVPADENKSPTDAALRGSDLRLY